MELLNWRLAIRLAMLSLLLSGGLGLLQVLLGAEWPVVAIIGSVVVTGTTALVLPDFEGCNLSALEWIGACLVAALMPLLGSPLMLADYLVWVAGSLPIAHACVGFGVVRVNRPPQWHPEYD